jgi:hypothetical protein
MKGVYYCPSCHREIVIPFRSGSNINIGPGINIACGNCKKGRVEIKIRDYMPPSGVSPSGNEENA